MTSLARAAFVAAAFTIVAAARLDAQAGTIRVTITGGAHPGTYEMTETCEVQPNAYPALHIFAFATGQLDPKAPRSMEFFTASGKGKPDGFAVAVLFRGTARYEIFAIPRELAPGRAPLPSGRGTMTVRQTATGPTAIFRGQTKDGVRMEGTVDCRSQS
jgi:hypothetical protein